ncbi:MAG: rod shape-determining protein [Bacillota bacterium]
MFAKELGIDLGSANTAVVVRRRGIVAREPSVVAIDRYTREVVAVGTRARHMIGRTPDSILPVQPVRGGVICDLDRTTALLRHMIRQIAHSRWLRPRLVLTAPTGISDVERRALLDAAVQAGAGEIHLIDEAVAAALGAELPVHQAIGSLVVDIGGGTAKAAVLSLRAVVISATVPIAGDTMDEAIIRHVRREHNLFIGTPTAERVKEQLGSAVPPADARTLVSGRKVANGLPAAVELSAHDIHAALREPLAHLDALLLGLLERTPPELLADISRSGIVLTGGVAQMAGLAERLTRLTGLAVRTADAPADAVARGTTRALESPRQVRLVSGRGR